MPFNIKVRQFTPNSRIAFQLYIIFSQGVNWSLNQQCSTQLYAYISCCMRVQQRSVYSNLNVTYCPTRWYGAATLIIRDPVLNDAKDGCNTLKQAKINTCHAPFHNYITYQYNVVSENVPIIIIIFLPSLSSSLRQGYIVLLYWCYTFICYMLHSNMLIRTINLLSKRSKKTK